MASSEPDGLARRVDRGLPVVVLAVVGLATLILYEAKLRRDVGPVFLGRLDGSTRVSLYESMAGSSGALLGFTVASLAILLSLDPDRSAIRRIQEMDTWLVLNRTLVYAASALGLTLIASTIGLAIDGHVVPREQFEVAVSVVSLIATAEFLVGAIAFAWLVMVAARETTMAARR